MLHIIRNNKSSGLFLKRLGVEHLEDRRLLAIMWANELDVNGNFDINNGFQAQYGNDTLIARELVNRAIDDWERVITNYNFAVDNDADPNNNLDDIFMLNVSAGPIAGRGVTGNFQFGADNRPFSADITLDDNGGGDGWFFDSTPLDDAEFTGIADAFQASFVDATVAGQQALNDFYRTITHEIGHAMGVLLITPNALESGLPWFDVNGNPVANPNPVNNNDAVLGPLIYVGNDQSPGGGFVETRLASDPDGIPNSGDELFAVNELWQYTLADNSTVTFTESGGGHFYEGLADPNVAGADQHLNELMNPGRVVPAGNNPAETTRQFISDLDAAFLADAYGYTVTLPSDLPDFTNANQDLFSSGTAHILFDANTSTLLIQGLANDPGNTNLRVDDIINIAQVGDDLRITLTYTPNGANQREFIRDIAADRVSQILIAGNGGTDMITNDTALDPLVQMIDYVVSSNEDALEAAGQSTTDGIVDVSTIVPGNQTTLRAAIVESNARAGAQSIYVGRNQYDLTRTGTEFSNGTNNDLDITGDVTIVGAGAGLSVIDASGFQTPGVHTRVFEIGSNGNLTLERLTVTGGDVIAGGGGILVNTGGAVRLDQVAMVDNSATGSGGGLLAVSPPNSPTITTSVDIFNSVFAGNASGQFGGGLLVTEEGAFLKIGNTIFANNTATIGRPDFRAANGATGEDWGNNMVEVYNIADQLIFGSGLGNVLNQAVDHVVTGMADVVNAGDDNSVLSLREAVLAIDAGGTGPGVGSIWVPAWQHRLTRNGAEAHDGHFNDIDIRRDVTIVGVGAGLTVIDASGLNDPAHDAHNRAFEIRGSLNRSLDISRVTVSSGTTTGDTAGNAVLLRAGGSLTLTDSAIANHTGMATGVAVRSLSSDVTIERSVFTNNESTTAGMGAVRSTGGGSLTIGDSVFALNRTPIGTFTNVDTDSLVIKTSLGNNLYDEDADGFFTGPTDILGTPDYVVTSVADTFREVDNAFSLSVREAINLANANDNVAEEIWLPPWTFVLTRDRTTFGIGTTDIDSAFGDLDISDSLTVRGIAGATSVAWRSGVVDAVFDLLGDYNGDGINNPDDGYTSGGDFLTWQQQNGSTGVPNQFSADGDDDGDVDAADLTIWQDHYGNFLSLLGVDVPQLS